MSDRSRYKIITDKLYGYKRLEPIPKKSELSSFYQSNYYNCIRKGKRAPGLARLTSQNEEDFYSERNWLRQTLYQDILKELEENIDFDRSLLDIGCGNGEFISFMSENNWEVAGLELSTDAYKFVLERGLKVFNLSVEDFIANHPEYLNSFKVVSMLNVLEHVPKPIELLRLISKLMTSQGVIVIKVPNDYNELQLTVTQKFQKSPWWIAIPDHINYFDFDSLKKVLINTGFDILNTQSDFPMEWFLLQGEDYIDNPDVGSNCHHKRVYFEMSLPNDLRRRIYKAFAFLGIGRNCIVFAKKNNL